MKKTKNEDDVRYQLTPKGIATVAMLQTGLIDKYDDPRFEGFWTLFAAEMKRCGYVEPGEGEEDETTT